MTGMWRSGGAADAEAKAAAGAEEAESSRRERRWHRLSHQRSPLSHGVTAEVASLFVLISSLDSGSGAASALPARAFGAEHATGSAEEKGAGQQLRRPLSRAAAEELGTDSSLEEKAVEMQKLGEMRRGQLPDWTAPRRFGSGGGIGGEDYSQGNHARADDAEGTRGTSHPGPLHLLDGTAGSVAGTVDGTGYPASLSGVLQRDLPGWLGADAVDEARALSRRRQVELREQRHRDKDGGLHHASAATAESTGRAKKKRARPSALDFDAFGLERPSRSSMASDHPQSPARRLEEEGGENSRVRTHVPPETGAKANDGDNILGVAGVTGGGSSSETGAGVPGLEDPAVSDPVDTFEGAPGMPDITPSAHNPEAESLAAVSGAGNTAAEVASYLLLFLLIFGMSATVDMKNLTRQLKNKFAIGTGVGMQFVIMPFLGFLAVEALKGHGLESHMGLTLLIVTASPGGSYSNWWCSTFNADLALSVAMTALSTLLSTVLLPANLMLYANAAYGLSGEGGGVLSHVDWSSLFISLGVVIAAILGGLFASYKIHSRKFRRWSNRLGTFSGVALIIFSAAFSTGTGSSEASLWGQDWSFYLGVGLPCVLGLAVANVLSRCFRLKKPEVVTLSVECCYQNVGIATSAAMAMFDDPIQRAEALCVPLFYGFVEAAVLGLYCVASWKLGWTKAPADEKLCVVIGTTYEVEDGGGVDADTQMAAEDGDHDLRLDEEVRSADASVTTRGAGDEEDGLGSLQSNRGRAGTADSAGSWSSFLASSPLFNRQRTRSADRSAGERFSDNDMHVQTLASGVATGAVGAAGVVGATRERSGTEERVEAHYSARWLSGIVDFFPGRRRRRLIRRRYRRKQSDEADVVGTRAGAGAGAKEDDKAKTQLAKDTKDGEGGEANRSRTMTESTESTVVSLESSGPLSGLPPSSRNSGTTGVSSGGLDTTFGSIPEDTPGSSAPMPTASGSAAASYSVDNHMDGPLYSTGPVTSFENGDDASVASSASSASSITRAVSLLSGTLPARRSMEGMGSDTESDV